jgi:molybdopterin converting factor small subunit
MPTEIAKDNRKCSKCSLVKSISAFYKHNEGKDGFRPDCKDCVRSRSKMWYDNNPKKAKIARKRWQKNNKNYTKEYQKNYYNDNKEDIIKYYKEWLSNNKEKAIETKRKWEKDNIDRVRAMQRDWAKKNPRKAGLWYINKRRTDPIFRMNCNISVGIWKSLREKKGGKHWENLVGYTLEELKKHLEKQFEEWMNWENYGQYIVGRERKWHIDHIIPKGHFKYETAEDKEFKECWALENLQPLEAVENIKKSNKILVCQKS